MRADSFRTLRLVEQIFLATGVTLVTIWGVTRFHRTVASRSAVAKFKAAEAESLREQSQPPDPTLGKKVDFRLWSPQRVAAYQEALQQRTSQPLAILRIPKVRIEVPVFDDTDEFTLNRGVGRIRGTARIGETGNLGIAGHRDGFFRGLKDITTGDEIELAVVGRTERYIVKQIQIVRPEDTSVLNKTAARTLTLVTCFPFYFVGSAPERYIVTASFLDSSRGN